MSLEHFNDLLRDLGKSVGLPDLKPSSDGLCSLRFDDRVTIDLECSEERGALIFSSIVGTLLPYQASKVYPELLEANLLWVGTGGATLGVDPATLSVFMCYQEKMEGMEFTRFQDLLKGFSDTALFWNKRLLENPEDGSEAIPPGAEQATSATNSSAEATGPAPAAGSYA
ncbi:MAG: type III secretion system chaperone [Chthoniobacterales bacterium]|nr:type III secretion system chaperone [Chthoniobacterales bacterium]